MKNAWICAMALVCVASTVACTGETMTPEEAAKQQAEDDKAQAVEAKPESDTVAPRFGGLAGSSSSSSSGGGSIDIDI